MDKLLLFKSKIVLTTTSYGYKKSKKEKYEDK